MKSSKSDVVSRHHWDSVNIKLADPTFVLKAVNCHDDLLEACKVVCQMFDDEVFIYGVDDRDKVLKWLRQAARTIAKATK